MNPNVGMRIAMVAGDEHLCCELYGPVHFHWCSVIHNSVISEIVIFDTGRGLALPQRLFERECTFLTVGITVTTINLLTNTSVCLDRSPQDSSASPIQPGAGNHIHVPDFHNEYANRNSAN